MPRYRIAIEYDGSAYSGWQSQPGVPTVQEAVEAALSTACREPIRVVGSGRTDAGVHARRQCAHFDVAASLDAARIQHSVNGLLSADIAVTDLRQTPDSFHARFDARSRVYHYHVSSVPRALDRARRVRVSSDVDFGRMNQSAGMLVGRHDFSSFCLTQSETANRVCNVESAKWTAESRPSDWTFEIRADRFLHGMVRAIVGTLLWVGVGKLEVDCIPGILAQRDRRAAGPAAKAHGLVLHDVRYDDDNND